MKKLLRVCLIPMIIRLIYEQLTLFFYEISHTVLMKCPG